jgi:hypothetical protein
MATAVGLNMKMTADTSGLGRGMTRAEKLLNGIDKNARSAASSLRVIATIQVGGALLKGLSSIAGTLTAATRSAVNYASSLASSIDETAKLAARTGIAVEALQGFQVAADLSGVQNLESAIQRLTITIGDAGAGVKEPQKAFERLGLDFERLSQLKPEDQFRAVAAAFQDVGTQADKAAIAADLFGRSGVELLPLFNSNLEEIEARANRLGIVLGSEQTAAIERMNDALSLVGKTIDGVIGQVLANIADVVTAITEEFLQFVEAFEGVNGAQGGNAIADVVTKAVLSGIEGFLTVVGVIGDGLLSFAETVGNTIRFIRTFTGGVDGDITRLRGELVAAQDRRRNLEFGSPEERAADREVLRIKTQLQTLSEGFDATGLRDSFANAIDAALVAAGDVRDRLENRDRNATPPKEVAEPAGNFFGQLADRFIEGAQQRGNRLASFGKQLVDNVVNPWIEKTEELAKINEQIAAEEERAAEIEADRLDALSRRSTQALTVGDVRSGGISEVMRLATGREDPAIAESRKQLAQLQKIEQRIADLRADKVKIIGGAGRAA